MALLQATAPAFADVTVGSANACVQQSANPHPTDPAGLPTASLFCASPSPTTNGSGTGTGSTGSGGTGSGTSGTGGSHGSGTTTAGGSQGTLTGSHGSGTSAGSNGSGISKSRGKSGQASDGGFFGGLVGFFSATGGLVFLFALLVLMATVLLAVAAMAWLRGGQEGS